jgi:hypothetical protein
MHAIDVHLNVVDDLFDQSGPNTIALRRYPTKKKYFIKLKQRYGRERRIPAAVLDSRCFSAWASLSSFSWWRSSSSSSGDIYIGGFGHKFGGKFKLKSYVEFLIKIGSGEKKEA